MKPPSKPRTPRHDFNETMLYRNGEPEPSKLWCNVGCGIVAYWMIALPDLVWKEWLASCAIACLLIAPDIARKIISIKAGNGKPEKPKK